MTRPRATHRAGRHSTRHILRRLDTYAPTDDLVMLAAKMACDAHRDGKLDDAGLMAVLRQCINARAIENGYADEYGLPFPAELAPTAADLAALDDQRDIEAEQDNHAEPDSDESELDRLGIASRWSDPQ